MLSNLVNNPLFKKLNIGLPNRTWQVNFILSLFYVVIFNSVFLSRFSQAALDQSTYDFWFVLSIPFFLWACLNLIFTILTFLLTLTSKTLLKSFYVMLVVSSAACYYFLTHYGTIMDTDMIVNLFETNAHEATELMNIHLVGWIFLLGVVPALIICALPIKHQKTMQEVFDQVLSFIASLIVIIVIAFFFYANYASVGRNNQHIHDYIVPTRYVSSLYKYTKNKYIFPAPKTVKVLDESPQLISQGDKKKVIVMVVGETARAKNFAYSGYDRNTNQHTQNLDGVFYQNVISCGTATAISVPCMFSRKNREAFSQTQAEYDENVLDVILKAGADVLWLDNDSGCKGVCERLPYKLISKKNTPELCDDEYCYDEALVGELDKKLDNLNKDVTVIVLHTIGSHGPTYYRRYPEKHKIFKPNCDRSDIQNCSQNELVNAYDNTILYADYINAQVIKTLKSHEQTVDSVMLYLSDHGESLGEKSVYLHGLPYAIAPAEQKEVPLYLWMSSAYKTTYNRSCMVENAQSQNYSHDNLFDTLLGVVGVQSTTYQAGADILNKCRNT